MGIAYLSATTKEVPGEKEIRYNQLTEDLMNEYLIVVNATPLGTFPKVDTCPDIPYQFITKDHVLYDLVYNPEETLFLKKGKAQGAKTKNGLEMLHLQALLRAWEIWNCLKGYELRGFEVMHNPKHRNFFATMISS